MEEEHIIKGAFNGQISLEYLPCINYAMIHNHIPSCSFCDISNEDDFEWKSVNVSIEGEFIKRSEVNIEIIPGKQNIQINKLAISPDLNKLIELTEGIHTTFQLTLTINGEIISQKEYEIYLMAFDQWSGSAIIPELLTAFVTPNHPLLSRVSINASKFLETWTGDSSLDEYQTQDPNRVRQQVAAIYEALRSESLVYCTPPASFEKYGQRIRLVDKVLNEKLGTCIDTTLLFASCLEANGIHPLLVLLKGHIFVGAWLTNDVYPRTVGDDASFLLKGCSDGINDIVLVETTALSSSQCISFEDAVCRAIDQLKQENQFELFIDVYRCRLDNIKPLPLRINKDSIDEIENDGIEHANVTTSVNQLNRFEIKLNDSKVELTKQIIWERKLLDFSLRNNLINIKLGKRVIPFISFDIDHLEDHLQAGENYQILPSPMRGKLELGDLGIYDSSLLKDSLGELIIKELQNKKIHSYLTDMELQNSLKFIYRTSRTSMEENGANSLFLVLGLLKWFETERSVKPRFAPILMLPVDIIRRGGTMGYVIRTRDEDIILNITLIELLKQQFGINLSGLTPLPKDDSGVDVRRIFATIRTLIRNLKGWDVIEESMLGLFSFNKFVMWNDIHSNADKMKENPVISSLMENRIKWIDTVPSADARQIDKDSEPINFALPVDVDSSQMEAVVESGEGKSFILHGPPGTGKSQTITNMIANALYKGKRVLFVAEKMAALSVVQDRLAKIGLDPFCLEMHSNKATKSHFLEQLQKAIDVAHIQSPTEYETLSKDLFERRKELINYMEALHRLQPSGFSLYECITNYLSIQGDELQTEQTLLPTFSKESLLQLRDELANLDTVFTITGHPQVHPLKGIYPQTISSGSIDRIKELLILYKEAYLRILDSKKLFKEKLSIDTIHVKQSISWMKEISNLIIKLPSLNKELLEMSGNESLVHEWREVADWGIECENIKSRILQSYHANIIQQNAFMLEQEWKGIQNQWFIPRFFAKRSFLKKLSLYNASLQENQVQILLTDLSRYQYLDKCITEQSSEIEKLFGLLGRRKKEKWNDILQVLELAPQLFALLMEYARISEKPFVDVISEFSKKIGTDWLQFKQYYEGELQQIVNSVDSFVSIEEKLSEYCEYTLPEDHEIVTALDSWVQNIDKMKDWYQWCVRKRELENKGLSVVVNYILQEHKGGKEASTALFKGVNHQMAITVIDSDESLQMFNGLLFEKIIDKYKKLTSDFKELSKKELYCRLAAKVPNPTMEAIANSEMGILKRNISNGGRGVSIRRIIDQIPGLLPKLCPCMLMSPISVAQYIDLDAEKFDLVIFDEASQMPTSEAVGAIARGNALVVVGDPKQMPPTSFFSSSQVDEEEAEFDDMESILDDCISLSIPSRYLTWHYRSKHESLIAFSNTQYYDGKLYTFPSVDDRTSKVRLVKVNGSYDKGRTRSNKEEAVVIVQEVIRRLKSPELSKRSIGIVSFSQVQQNLIEDMLMDELCKYPELEEKAFQCNEPIFIKNLENVQGDERDVILFSIGYGPDKNGNISMNFGPLNNKGGERRLNVAVSRARYEMIIYSTLRPEQIDLKRTKAKGVEGLKKFLEFAERGVSISNINQLKETSQNNLISLIADELVTKGYKIDTAVGRSNFKVDLAVINPKKPDQYLLGILCDGKNYFDTKTTRDREIVQPSVLSMLHWNIMRVWSVDWFQNKDMVISRIIEKIEELIKSSDKVPAQEPIQENTFKSFSIANEPIVELKNENEKEYEFAQISAIGYNSDIDVVISSPSTVKKQLKDIIAIEQPITNTLLYKRIAQIWNLSRVTGRLQTMIDSQLKDNYLDPLSDQQKIYWINENISKNYHTYRINSKRDVLDIPIVEVMNAALYIVNQQISMPAEDLKRLTSQVLGFARKGTNVDLATSKAVNLLLEKGTLQETNGMISMS